MALGGDLVCPRGYFKTPTPWAPVPTPLGTGGQKGWKTTHLPSHFWVVVQRSNVSKIGMEIVFGPKNFLRNFLEWRNWRRDHNTFSKVSHFFSCFFFKRAFFRQFAADPGPISVKNFLLVWIFQKCPKKSGKCISDTSSLPDVFWTVRPLISALLLRLAWFLACRHGFGLIFFHLKFHQFLTTGWPVAAAFRFENLNFRDFFRFSRIFRELATNQRPMTQFFGYPTKNAKFWYIEHGCRAENRARRAAQRQSVLMNFTVVNAVPDFEQRT